MGSAGSLRIRVHPSLILWISVMFYGNPVLVCVFFLASALHEMGHILALHQMGKAPINLTLTMLGAQMEVPPLSYRQEFLAAAAGPCVSLLLTCVFPVWPALGLCSLCLGLFNLLPIPGLDGGRMLSSLLLLHLPEPTAIRIRTAAAWFSGAAVWATGMYLSLILNWGFWPVLLAAMLLIKILAISPNP